ncbi:hypothetical protein MLD38_028406 [Melastoma candidum]|uniref:Uncharacterized protein n=1 Tax=Melastoma candidum TaxID=119954 RepID=A0ACB9N362_9MYRT|nr:hypothetical protein MLD38_028406 [Melastoma candidum]
MPAPRRAWHYWVTILVGSLEDNREVLALPHGIHTSFDGKQQNPVMIQRRTRENICPGIHDRQRGSLKVIGDISMQGQAIHF